MGRGAAGAGPGVWAALGIHHGNRGLGGWGRVPAGGLNDVDVRTVRADGARPNLVKVGESERSLPIACYYGFGVECAV